MALEASGRSMRAGGGALAAVQRGCVSVAFGVRAAFALEKANKRDFILATEIHAAGHRRV